MLRSELASRELNSRNILLAIMLVHARIRNKNSIGAKFPMHYSFSSLLLDWFPNCRMLHTTREPKAVYSSQAAKYITESHGSLSKAFIRFMHFVHINLQVSWTARVHTSLNHLDNYRLVRYEDVVTDADRTIRSICDFLGIEFVENMLSPKQYGSSFGKIGDGHGVETSSLEKWRSSISPVTAGFIDLAHVRARRAFGYASHA